LRINSNDIPQADLLEDVLKTVIAVSQGRRSFQDIASYINKVDRQGRYYRRAAELLGLIKNRANTSVLTGLGEEFVRTNATFQNTILIQKILSIRIFQRLIAFFEMHPEGISRNEIIVYLGNVTSVTKPTMLRRRVVSLLSWLSALNIIEERNQRYKLKGTVTRQIPLLEFTEPDEPILPRTSNLGEYKTVDERASSAKREITIYRDQAKLDRADNAHRQLVNLVADRVRRKGSLPRSNVYIDLAARIDEGDYIFEMKSITEDNAKGQVRMGISQLYEYRYLQNIPDANLVLVLENNLPPSVRWMNDYLESDRNIMLVWDGNNRLYARESTKNRLDFLW
jgi:hypothetical protein